MLNVSFTEKAREVFAHISCEIQNKDQGPGPGLTLDELCELVSLAEEGLTALNAAVNLKLDQE